MDLGDRQGWIAVLGCDERIARKVGDHDERQIPEAADGRDLRRALVDEPQLGVVEQALLDHVDGVGAVAADGADR